MVGFQEVSCFFLLDALATQISNVTLTESGDATLRFHTQLWLLEAARDDTSTVLTQINVFNSFLAQVTSSSGKGPCFLTHDRANRATKICATKAYTAEFSNKCAHSEAIENTNPQVFVPVKTKTGIEGTFVQKKKKKKAVECK